MKRLAVELDDKLHREFKLRALQKGKSMREYVMELIQNELKKEE